MTAINMAGERAGPIGALFDGVGKSIWVVLMLSPLSLFFGWFFYWPNVLFVSVWALIIATFSAALYGMWEMDVKRRDWMQGSPHGND